MNRRKALAVMAAGVVAPGVPAAEPSMAVLRSSINAKVLARVPRVTRQEVLMRYLREHGSVTIKAGRIRPGGP